MEILSNIWDWVKEHKKATAGIVGVVLLIFLMVQANKHAENKNKVAIPDKQEVVEDSSEGKQYIEGTDAYLMSMQPELRKSFGTPPKGFIWDLDGKSISLGNKSMSSEDVLYAYIRALSTLDFATAEKYSRGTKVVETYNDYFSTSTASQADYQEQFLRNMYKEALTSIEITGVESSATFANNKVVYTVKVSMLDLTSKDFWQEDKDNLFKNMSIYETQEDDSTKLNIFLYDYILNYYKSDNALKREISFDITLERYPDIDSGWLVSIDKDIDDAAKYSNGKLVTNYIVEQFRNYVINKQNSKNVGVPKSTISEGDDQ